MQPASATDAYSVRYNAVRAHSLALTEALSAEDQCIQSMPDASPAKWHLAHTTWFFETVLLKAHSPGYQSFDPRFHYFFNSYYESLGPRHPRPQRGLLTRPSLDEVHAYRRQVDAGVMSLLDAMQSASDDDRQTVRDIVMLGLHHEQQHQELIVTDMLHAMSCNPALPAMWPAASPSLRLAHAPAPARWIRIDGDRYEIGTDAGASVGDFSFDNEGPRHAVLLQPCEVASRLVTCGEYAQFIADGGYQRPELWLSDGWAAVQADGWQAPPYWLAADDARLTLQDGAVQPPGSGWHVFGVHGVKPLEAETPVSQLSFYEAAAYAEWSGARLPTEQEWEVACATGALLEATGHAWQWTRSSYDPYPGFKPMPGVASEYNGKFMVGQLVLRGGSMATPEGHSRPSYRNFFPPAARWQFSGLRLARDI